MAYNTRRSQDGGNPSPIGQRRTNPPIGNSFVAGGQLAPSKVPVVQQAMQQQQQQQQRPGPQGPFNTPQNGRQQQQGQNPQQRAPQQIGGAVGQRNVVSKPLQPQQQPQQQQQRPAQAQQQQQQQQQQQPPTKVEESAQQGEGAEGEKKKPFWAKNSGSVLGLKSEEFKISRKEKQRRRNLRLGKILQPKNAVMILNELVKNTIYNVSDVASIDNQYTATVVIEGITHSGQGRSKMEAKNQAAESALKYIVKNRQLTALKTEDGEQSMEVDSANDSAEGTEGGILPWQHVASFALFKLLSSWGEDPNQAKGFGAGNTDAPLAIASTNKPAKKMPENGSTLNPLMLMNQMLPNAQFEELPRVGNPPNITFTFKCTANGEIFTGSGNTKKNAKKFAAYAVCSKILGVKYPADVFIGY